MITASSQHYLNDEIVAEKLAAEDFEVLVSPVFRHEGVEMRVVLDGHHSRAAAIEAGVLPVYVEATATEHDAVALIQEGDDNGAFLEATWVDGDYYNVETGRDVW